MARPAGADIEAAPIGWRAGLAARRPLAGRACPDGRPGREGPLGHARDDPETCGSGRRFTPAFVRRCGRRHARGRRARVSSEASVRSMRAETPASVNEQKRVGHRCRGIGAERSSGVAMASPGSGTAMPRAADAALGEAASASTVSVAAPTRTRAASGCAHRRPGCAECPGRPRQRASVSAWLSAAAGLRSRPRHEPVTVA